MFLMYIDLQVVEHIEEEDLMYVGPNLMVIGQFMFKIRQS